MLPPYPTMLFQRRTTRGQFSKLVEQLARPSAIFFLPTPPVRTGVPIALRNAPALEEHELTRDEIRQIRWARRLQEITAWVLHEQEAPPVSLDRASSKDNSASAAQLLRSRLGTSGAEQLGWQSPNEAFRAWRLALEDLGVLVLQLSLGKGNIRGFSAWNDRAPIVAVNTSYHPTARIFTLFHEVAHLITRTDSACLRFVVPDKSEPQLERWCERFAAELLIPADTLGTVAASYGVEESSRVSDVNVVRLIANRFNVSTRAMSLRLQELDLAPTTLYSAVVQAYSRLDWNQHSGGGGGGQPAAEKRLDQLGTRIPSVLFDAAAGGRLNAVDVADYLRLNTNQVEDLRSLVGIHG